MSLLWCARITVIIMLAAWALYMTWPAIRAAMRGRNRYVSGVLGAPHPSCERKYTP
jgi:hypothetical protein